MFIWLIRPIQILKERKQVLSFLLLLSYATAQLTSTKLPNNEIAWWKLHGGSTPDLKKMVVRVLSLTTSSGCERAWSTFEMNESFLTLRDLKGCKLSGNFFNILFNLNKFVAFENRDPFLIRQEREDPTLTEWDRFAHREYIRLSMEEDGEDISNGSGDAWNDSLEAPNF